MFAPEMAYNVWLCMKHHCWGQGSKKGEFSMSLTVFYGGKMSILVVKGSR